MMIPGAQLLERNSEISIRQPSIPLFFLSLSCQLFILLVGHASTRRLFRGENNEMRVERWRSADYPHDLPRLSRNHDDAIATISVQHPFFSFESPASRAGKSFVSWL